jgi:uncharacterized membrane protein (DUF4010 family)
VLALSGGVLCVAAYTTAVRRPAAGIDGTTEVAALTIIALGVIAGLGLIGIAAGAGAIVVFMLSEKARLHWLVRQLGEPELRGSHLIPLPAGRMRSCMSVMRHKRA